jgi:N-carbamoyl-L-amino-acid hydrolase
MFDGSLGVLAALECFQTIQENRLIPNLSLEIVAFSDEEGAFVSFLGSRAATDTLNADDLEAVRNMAGFSLQERMAACGLNMEEISQAKINPEKIKAYLELHIEQGPRLDVANISVGIVQAIVGIVSYRITFEGEANHAGTTPLNLRRDAFLGAAEFSLKVHDWIRSETHGVVTIGNAELLPGAFNIVPGMVHLALEFRDASAKQLESMESSILKIGHEIAAQRNLKFEAKPISRDSPVRLNPRMIEILQAEAEQLGYQYLLMDSGAGHDAQILAQITETGMIFVPSIGGMSHCPQEASHWSDIEKGVQLLLNCILRLANEEDVHP